MTSEWQDEEKHKGCVVPQLCLFREEPRTKEKEQV